MEVVIRFVVIATLISTSTRVTVSSEQNNLLVPTPSLLVVTLDGNYHALNKKNGQIKWTLKDEPTVTIPYPVSDKNLFLPDPKDGSLYAVNDDGSLKKLPFTIPELVTAAPCRSSDGILYTGRKVDVWYSIDMLTGAKHEVLSAVTGPNDKICPQLMPYSIFMGKSEYTMTMYDGKTGERRWNVTYSCIIPHDVVGQYDLAHFTATSSGLIVTVDKETGSVLWLQDYKSPIVAMYALDHEGLHSVPFTSVASETLSYLTAQMALSNQDKLLPENTTLYPKLFIGRSEHGLYALPSLADDKAKNNFGPKLLPGPVVNNSNPAVNQTSEIKSNKSFINGNSNSQYQVPAPPTSKEKFLIVIGYYDIPSFSSVKVTPPLQIGMELKDKFGKKDEVERDTNHILLPTANQSDLPDENNNSILLEDLWHNVVFASTVVAIFISCFVYVVFKSNFSVRKKTIPAEEVKVSPILQEGHIQIGKIELDLHKILGKGCDGTCVYKGKFDGREVAVKRILPDCFDFADREVTLLREADAHPNVIRYFSMEQDLQFRYLALELCAATVADYVENNAEYNYGLDSLTLLNQATCGLEHLHSLNIVHRDIKPQNVLLSYPCNATGKAKVMISDFGLCKKLLSGRASFSKRSGSAGTEGWIAPEMMIDDSRMTCQVDIFSIGCVFYYVLSGGHHPFGDNLHRQSNILNGKYNLKHLTENSKVIALHLVEKMISQKPEDRPPCDAILKHPLFWTPQQQMDFLQDVSDRVEKEPLDSSVLIYLERNSANVVRGDWKNHIGNELLADLRQFRSYRGRSIRDLMRAIRNKKHHYRELTEDVKTVLGDTPSKFITYFTTRFPNLIPHVYYAMQCCKSEPVFNRYYTDYNFKLGLDVQDEGSPSFSPGGSPWHRNKMKKAEENKEQMGAVL